MNDLTNLTSKISQQLESFLNMLQEEKPKQEFSLLYFETKMLWMVSWKSTNYLKEYCELEIWKDNNKYSLMCNYKAEAVFENLTEELFLLEEKTIKELLAKSDEILNEFRKGVQKSSNQ